MGKYDMGPRNDILGRTIPADFFNQFQVLMLEVVNFGVTNLRQAPVEADAGVALAGAEPMDAEL